MPYLSDVQRGAPPSTPLDASDRVLPDWISAPACRCERPMQLTLIVQRPDGTQIRSYKCTGGCDHQLRVTVWAN
jgi:hypothetical protein